MTIFEEKPQWENQPASRSVQKVENKFNHEERIKSVLLIEAEYMYSILYIFRLIKTYSYPAISDIAS